MIKLNYSEARKAPKAGAFLLNCTQQEREEPDLNTSIIE
jgi:hypothetical protein